MSLKERPHKSQFNNYSISESLAKKQERVKRERSGVDFPRLHLAESSEAGCILPEVALPAPGPLQAVPWALTQVPAPSSHRLLNQAFTDVPFVCFQYSSLENNTEMNNFVCIYTYVIFP